MACRHRSLLRNGRKLWRIATRVRQLRCAWRLPKRQVSYYGSAAPIEVRRPARRAVIEAKLRDVLAHIERRQALKIRRQLVAVVGRPISTSRSSILADVFRDLSQLCRCAVVKIGPLLEPIRDFFQLGGDALIKARRQGSTPGHSCTSTKPRVRNFSCSKRSGRTKLLCQSYGTPRHYGTPLRGARGSATVT